MGGLVASTGMVRKRKVDRPLRRDVRYLGSVLGEVLVEQEGRELFDLEERVRHLAKERRRGPADQRGVAEHELAALLAALPIERAEPVIRAFSTYFSLVNLAEQHHRIRRARAHAQDVEPQRGSVEAILRKARERGVSAERAREALATLEVTLTLTAHPTQAARRTVLEKLDRIARILEQRDRCTLTPAEVRALREQVRAEVGALWQTDELRRERPTVGDEVKNVLWYVEEVLWDLLPRVPQALADAFEAVYGEPLGSLPMPLRLHSWVGGDMDGNPLVTPDVLEDSIRAHEARALRRILRCVEALGAALSQSERYTRVPPRLLASLAEDERRMPEVARRFHPRTEGEPWRRKLRYVETRLAATLAQVEERRLARRPPDAGRLVARLAAGQDALPGGPDLDRPGLAELAYRNAAELVVDLEVVAESLQEARAERAGLRQVLDLLAQVRAVGFHILELELRAPAEDARAAAAWLDEGAAPTEGGTRFFQALQRIAAAQRESGAGACRTVILSMASGPEDVRATLRCARAAGLWDDARGCAHIDIVPLFETLQALDEGPEILRSLLRDPIYGRHVRARGVQEVMVGYSDSGKEVGLLAAHGALRRIQERLPEIAGEEGIPLRVFHGRGESVARGGGPAQQAILSLPPGSVAGRYKATEQGEALDHKYARPELAMRTLELIIGGALLHTLDAQDRPDDEELERYRAIYDELAEIGRKAWRKLVWEEPRFVEFFQAATPIEAISGLPIGSRPAKRRAGGPEALRAIPWVFAWTQNRAILPGWYGVGSALERWSEREGGLEELSAMYRRWPAFRTIVDNVEMVLAKSDIRIAARYAALASREARKAVWPRIRHEYRCTRRMILAVTGHKVLLEGNGPLRRSIRLRNPYVDPMSFLQVDLMGRQQPGDDRCDRPLQLTLSGISAGMRNTG